MVGVVNKYKEWVEIYGVVIGFSPGGCEINID